MIEIIQNIGILLFIVILISLVIGVFSDLQFIIFFISLFIIPLIIKHFLKG